MKIRPSPGGFVSNPPSGGFRIVNMYVNAAGKLVVVYDDKPIK